MRLEPVELGERPRIDEKLDPLAGGQLPDTVLLLEPLCASAELGSGVVLVELFDLLVERQD